MHKARGRGWTGHVSRQTQSTTASGLQQHLCHDQAVLQAITEELNSFNQLGVLEVENVQLTKSGDLHVLLGAEATAAATADTRWVQVSTTVDWGSVGQRTGGTELVVYRTCDGWRADLVQLDLSGVPSDSSAVLMSDPPAVEAIKAALAEHNGYSAAGLPSPPCVSVLRAQAQVRDDQQMCWEVEVSWQHPACEHIWATASAELSSVGAQWTAVITGQKLATPADDLRNNILLDSQVEQQLIACLASHNALGLKDKALLQPKAVHELLSLRISLGAAERQSGSWVAVTLMISWGIIGSDQTLGDAELELSRDSAAWTSQLRRIGIDGQMSSLADHLRQESSAMNALYCAIAPHVCLGVIKPVVQITKVRVDIVNQLQLSWQGELAWQYEAGGPLIAKAEFALLHQPGSEWAASVSSHSLTVREAHSAAQQQLADSSIFMTELKQVVGKQNGFNANQLTFCKLLGISLVSVQMDVLWRAHVEWTDPNPTSAQKQHASIVFMKHALGPIDTDQQKWQGTPYHSEELSLDF